MTLDELIATEVTAHLQRQIAEGFEQVESAVGFHVPEPARTRMQEDLKVMQAAIVAARLPGEIERAQRRVVNQALPPLFRT